MFSKNSGKTENVKISSDIYLYCICFLDALNTLYLF